MIVRTLAIVVLVIVFSTPTQAAEDSTSALNATSGDHGVPRYRLGVDNLDGNLGLADGDINDAIKTLTAQASGDPAPAEASTRETDGPEDSASELNRKLTNPVSSLWSLPKLIKGVLLE